MPLHPNANKSSAATKLPVSETSQPNSPAPAIANPNPATVAQSHDATAEVKTPPVALTSDAKKALFATYHESNDRVDAADKAAEAARTERSTHIAAIVSQMGAGPFKTRGEEINFVKGKGSNVEGNETRWTVRKRHEKDVQEIG